MIRSFLSLAIASMSLAGCTPSITAPPTTPSAQPGDTAAPSLIEAVSVSSYKALALSAIAYDSAAKVATAGVRSGVIRGSALDTLKALNQRATMALWMGYSAGSVAEQARAAAELDDVVRQIKNLAAP